MSDGAMITFLVTQLLLPFGLGYLYCKRKGIPTNSWRAGGIYLIALSLATLFFMGILGLPSYVKNVGMVTNRSMGFTVGAIGIVAGIVMGYIARRFEDGSSDPGRPAAQGVTQLDIRFLSLSEFHSIYFYRFITLAILLAMAGLTLFKLFETPLSDIVFMFGCLSIMAWRFAVEWRRVQRSGPAFLHNDELVITSANNHQQIPLTKIRSIKSRHCIFMARRYRSWDDHVAFLEITLNNGERAYTLAESAVLEFPAGKQTLEALRTTVAAAKAKSLASQHAIL